MIRIRHKGALGRGDLFLPILATVWAVALASYAFVWIVDPYELRSTKPFEQLADHAYPEPIVPRLVPVAAKDGTDLAIVGGSTAMGYTPAMMRRDFPDAQRPFNLAFPCVTADDLALILPRLETSKSLRRVIISLDFTLMWHCVSMGSPLDDRYYREIWYDPVPEYNLEAIELSAWVLRTGVLDIAAWRPRLPDRVDGVNFASALTDSPQAIAAIARDAESRRASVTAGQSISCEAVPALKDVVMPFVRHMAARGVSIDLLAPPYSLALYSNWTTDADANSGAVIFQRLIAIRRCALQMSAGIAHVRFHTFDTTLSIVGDLSHYGDVGHIREYEVYDYILKHIAAGDAVLAPSQWPEFEAQMKSDLENFKPR